jgi:hypothetical protein
VFTSLERFLLRAEGFGLAIFADIRLGAITDTAWLDSTDKSPAWKRSLAPPGLGDEEVRPADNLVDLLKVFSITTTSDRRSLRVV